MPDAKRERFADQYALSAYDASLLTTQRALADYYEELAARTKAPAKLAANWVIGELGAALNRANLDIGDSRVTASGLAALLDKIQDGTISGKIAKEVFEALWAGEGSVAQIIADRGLEQISDTASIAALVDQVIAANAAQAEQYRSGKTQVFGYFVGQVMKASRGKANPQQVNEILREKLES